MERMPGPECLSVKFSSLNVGPRHGGKRNDFKNVHSSSPPHFIIFRTRTVDGYAASAITVDDITPLDHKLGDHTVKFSTLVAKAILMGTEFQKVLGGFRDYVVKELRDEIE